MSNLELGCKWHFASQTGGAEDGANEAMQQNFKKHPYASLIRESIQNSLDAAKSTEEPIEMEFTIRRIQCRDYPNFFELRKHVAGCLNYYSSDKKARQQYGNMIALFDKIEHDNKLFYVSVADKNTKGMNYRLGDTTSTFYAFVKSKGVSNKSNETSGGSYGFGKAAYLNISPLRTMLVSTMTEGGKSFFEGVASLCTHTFDNADDKRVAVGYYDNNNGEPQAFEENIPVRFKRAMPGTSIFIMGVDGNDKANIYQEMRESVLRNFWLAIHENKLVVRIGDETSGWIVINNETLQEVLTDTFKHPSDDKVRATTYIPFYYYVAVKGRDIKGDFFFYWEKDMPTLGLMRFYALRAQVTREDNILYMRQPRMLVYAKGCRTKRGFYGVVVCDGDKGNEVLKNMEPPSHDEWKANNWRDSQNKIVERGRIAEREIQLFVKEAIERMFPENQDNTSEIVGLEEFLYIPTAVEDDEEAQLSPDDNIVQGGADDGNTPTTNINPETNDIASDNGSNKGKVIVTTRRTRPRTKTGEDKPKKKEESDSTQHKKRQGRKSPVATEVDVKCRAIAKKKDGKTIHTLIIHSEYEFDNGRLDIVVGGEQEDDILPLVSCSSGRLTGNSIEGLHINKGINRVDVEFEDNMRHAIILKAYEVR